MSDADPRSVTELPTVVKVPDQPCQQLYEANPVLLGYDVVQYHFIPSYHEGGQAVRGLPEHAYNFLGYQFWFSSRINRELFIRDPWKYAPAWGGFCSWGVARETSAKWPWAVTHLGPPASPWTGWLIVNDTLMFNIWSSYSDRFLEEVDWNVELAVQRWKDWFGSVHAGPFNTHCIGHGPLQNWCMKDQPSPWLEPLPNCTLLVEKDGQQVEVTEEEYTALLLGEEQEKEQEQNQTAVVIDANCASLVARTAGVIPAECEETLALTNDNSAVNVELVSVNGGGIVGESQSTFSDFENGTSEYLQRRAIAIAGAVVGGLLVASLAVWVLVSLKRARASRFVEVGEVEEAVKAVEEPAKTAEEPVKTAKR